jgi:ribonuclease HI
MSLPTDRSSSPRKERRLGGEVWVVYADGASRGNPGPAAYGAVVIDPEGLVKQELSKTLGVTTNNVAEYRGLIAGLEAALEVGADTVEVRLDSELLVRQMNRLYRVKNAGLKPLHDQAQRLQERFNRIEFKHVPRAQNKLADALANKALDQA